jgi:hypothetical protein
VVDVLTGAGWRDVAVETQRLPFWAGHDAEDAFAFVSGVGVVQGALGGLPEDERPAALERLRAALAEHASSDGVLIDSCALLVSARR